MIEILLVLLLITGIISAIFAKKLDTFEDKVKDRIGWFIAQIIIKYRKER
jgi:hypothetical protein